MSELTFLLIFAAIAYLLGSINLSIVAAGLAGIDGLRASGSGNPGVTNLYRSAGGKIAFVVLLGEIGKAFLAVGLARIVDAEYLPLLVLPYVLGNLFPLFHRFKGGKGVSAVVGSFLAANPWIMLLGGGVFFLFFLIFRRVSVGSLTMICSYPVWAILLSESDLMLGICVTVGVLIVFTHRQNIGRLLRGEEPGLKKGR